MPGPNDEFTTGCSITGGVFCRGQRTPDWEGGCLFSDYCSGLVMGLRPTAGGCQLAQIAETQLSVGYVGAGLDGEVVFVDTAGRGV